MDPISLLDELIRFSLNTEGPKSAHITRYATFKALSGILSKKDSDIKTALSISNSEHLAKICGINRAKLQDVHYPEFNILSLPFKENSFDFIFSDQVIEHVRGDIPKLYRDLAKILRPGGSMVHCTPFIVEIHPTPYDCWRITPDGLRWLAEQAGLTVDTCGGWGNRLMWLYNILGHRFEPVPDDPTHPINKLANFNEVAWPVNVWIVCSKPGCLEGTGTDAL